MLSPSRGKRSALHPLTALTLRFALLLLPLLLLTSPREVKAYQWMLKHGYASCVACHADPSGGELLTLYGRMQSEATLSMWGGASSSSEAAQSSYKPSLARNPLSLAARAKLADKKGKAKAEEEKEAEEAQGDEEVDTAPAEAESSEEPAAEESAAPAEAAAEESDGLGPITPFLFRLWEPPDWLLLGGSYRHLNVIKPTGEEKFSTFPMMMDIYGQLQFGSFKAGGSIGLARVDAGSPYARPAQITTSQGHDWNLLSRTHYIGYDISETVQIRAGRLNLPFGVRIPEHTMWVRQATRTDRESSQQHGVSLSYNGENFRFELMGIAGNYQVNPDQFRERGYSGYFEYYLSPQVILGVNSLTTYAEKDRVLLKKPMLREAHGAMLRTVIGESTVIAVEADALYKTGYELGYVGFAQIDFEATQGLHFMLTGEILDQGRLDPKYYGETSRVAGQGKPQLGGWLSAAWWFLPHFDVRLDAVQRQDEDLTLLAQLHVYL